MGEKGRLNFNYFLAYFTLLLLLLSKEINKNKNVKV